MSNYKLGNCGFLFKGHFSQKLTQVTNASFLIGTVKKRNGKMTVVFVISRENLSFFFKKSSKTYLVIFRAN